MATKVVTYWMLLTTLLCEAVAATTIPARTPQDQLTPGRFEQATTPRAAAAPIVLARSERRERRREWRRERRQEWRHERRKEWRKERREAAIGAAAGGLIVGGIAGAAAASARRQQYRQDLYNYPDYGAGSGYPYYPR